MSFVTKRRGVRRPWPLFLLSVIAVVAAMTAAMPQGVANAQNSPDYPDDSAGTPIGTPEGTPAAPGGEIGKADTSAAPEGSVVYDVDGASSTASYTAEQELAGVGADEAVGKTNAILGQIVLGPDGVPLAGSRVDVDLRTFDSGETLRDNTLHTEALESDKFPVGTLIVTEIENWTAPLAEGQMSQFGIVGDLTVHGVTKEVRWDATATLEGTNIKGSASTKVKLADFQIEKPTNSFVLGINDEIELKLEITAAPPQ